MNDPEIDRLLGLARPTPPARLSPGGAELLEEIVSLAEVQPGSPHPAMESIEVGAPPRIPGPRRGRRVLMAVGVVLVVVAAILTPVLLGGNHKTASPAAPSVTGNPYFLMKTPGWKIDQVMLDYGNNSAGVVRFDGPGEAVFQVFWAGPSPDEQEEYQGLLKTYGKPSPTRLFGGEAELFEFSAAQGSLEYLVVPEPGQAKEKGYLSIAGGGTDLKTFQQQVQGLVRVTPEQWYAAVGDRVVSAGNLSAQVARVLTGVPLPKGFDTAKYTKDIPAGYDEFGEKLTAAVACGWMNSYRKAWTAGDEPGMAAIEKTLRKATDWPFVQQAAQAPTWVDGLPPNLARMAARRDLTDGTGNFYCPA